MIKYINPEIYKTNPNLKEILEEFHNDYRKFLKNAEYAGYLEGKREANENFKEKKII